MGKKKRTTINIDEEILSLLQLKVPSVSAFFEEQARAYLLGNNKLEDLKEELADLKARENAVSNEIDKLEKLQEYNNQNEELIENAMQTVRRYFFKNGSIPRQNINFIANSNGLSYDVLEDRIKKEGINISKF